MHPAPAFARTVSSPVASLDGWVGLLAMIESFVQTWDPDRRVEPKKPGEEIYIRDGWRCTAPGCTSRRNLEDHHITYRSRGGSDDLSNRTCLCRFHHQMGEHGGLARLRDTAPLGVTWRLGRESLNGAFYRNEMRIREARP